MNRLCFTVQRYDKVSGIQNKNVFFSSSVEFVIQLSSVRYVQNQWSLIAKRREKLQIWQNCKSAL